MRFRKLVGVLMAVCMTALTACGPTTTPNSGQNFSNGTPIGNDQLRPPAAPLNISSPRSMTEEESSILQAVGLNPGDEVIFIELPVTAAAGVIILPSDIGCGIAYWGHILWNHPGEVLLITAALTALVGGQGNPQSWVNDAKTLGMTKIFIQGKNFVFFWGNANLPTTFSAAASYVAAQVREGHLKLVQDSGVLKAIAAAASTLLGCKPKGSGDKSDPDMDVNAWEQAKEAADKIGYKHHFAPYTATSVAHIPAVAVPTPPPGTVPSLSGNYYVPPELSHLSDEDITALVVAGALILTAVVVIVAVQVGTGGAATPVLVFAFAVVP